MRSSRPTPARRLRHALTGVAAVLAAVASSPQGAQLVRTEDAIVALFSLQTDLEVEQRILDQEERRYEANVRQRADLRDRLGRLYDELEALFQQETTDRPPGRDSDRQPSEAEVRAAAEAKEAEVMTVERAEEAARQEGKRLRDGIRQIRSRISILGDKIDALRAGLPKDRDSVTGIWDITILPANDHGVFALWQTGTIVSGQYVLDGPFRGSLEGTLINRQIHLKRIDARLGRVMELTGYLAEDGQQVQGTWLNYDLSSGRTPTGQWSARKRSSAPSEAAPPPSGEPGP